MVPADFDFERGCAEHAAGRRDAALALFSRVLAAQPNHAGALHRLGVLHLDRGETDLGEALLARALALEPDSAALYCELARARQLQARVAESIPLLQAALQLQPRFALAQKLLGDALLAQGDVASSIAAFLNALNIQSDYPEARQGLGNALFLQRDFAGAIQAYEAALATRPTDGHLLANLAGACSELERYDDAVAYAERAIAAAPLLAGPHLAIGSACLQAGRFDEALAAFGRALALAPHDRTALNNYGVTLLSQNRVEEGLAHFTAARRAHPEAEDLRFNQSIGQLLRGDLVAGWENYEARVVHGCGRAANANGVPEWSGAQPVEGRAILLHSEQGHGDTLQFLRYGKLVAERGARVHLGVYPALKSLCLDLPWVASVVLPGEPLPPLDFQAPLLSLPRLFGTRLETIPAAVPYLGRSPEKIAAWRAALGDGFKVGLVWSGNPAHKNDRQRSIPLADFARITRDLPGRFFSLQKDPRPSDAALLQTLPCVADLAPRLHDFTDTAAAIGALDLVITVDTSVAHLAGALGARTWVLLPFAPDWRWMLERPDSPWYPTLRLHRQPARGAWAPVLEAVHAALAALVS